MTDAALALVITRLENAALRSKLENADAAKQYLNPDDMKYEVYPIEGIDRRGGQHVGGHSGVRATHIPSGVAAYVNIGCSQHVHKQIADDMILAAITHPKF